MITFYDFSNTYPRVLLPVVGLLILLIGSLLLIRIQKGYLSESNTEKNEHIFLGIILMFFGILTAWRTLNLPGYYKSCSVYKEQKWKTCLGLVENFEKNRFTKSNNISFTVKGIQFHFSNQDMAYGCDFDDLDGIRIKNGTLLEIYYFNDGGKNVVLRMRKIPIKT